MAPRFLISTLDVGEWSVPRPGGFIPEEPETFSLFHQHESPQLHNILCQLPIS
jgi:hypothetical protein